MTWELAVGTISMAARTMRGLILPPRMHQGGAVARGAAGTAGPCQEASHGYRILGNSVGKDPSCLSTTGLSSQRRYNWGSANSGQSCRDWRGMEPPALPVYEVEVEARSNPS